MASKKIMYFGDRSFENCTSIDDIEVYIMSGKLTFEQLISQSIPEGVDFVVIESTDVEQIELLVRYFCGEPYPIIVFTDSSLKEKFPRNAIPEGMHFMEAFTSEDNPQFIFDNVKPVNKIIFHIA